MNLDIVINKLLISVAAAFLIVLAAVIISAIGYTECFVSLAVIITAIAFWKEA